MNKSRFHSCTARRKTTARRYSVFYAGRPCPNRFPSELLDDLPLANGRGFIVTEINLVLRPARNGCDGFDDCLFEATLMQVDADAITDSEVVEIDLRFLSGCHLRVEMLGL